MRQRLKFSCSETTPKQFEKMVDRSRHVFIDLGAFNGDTLDIALKYLAPIDDVYCFEPLPQHCDSMRQRFAGRGFHFIQAAADLKDGTTLIYMGDEYGDIAASTLEGNPNCTSESISVPTVDFPRFLRETFENWMPFPRITLKLNIEGSEYPILEKLISDGEISRITSLYCDWHWGAVRMKEEDHHSIVRQLRSLGYPLCGGKPDELYNSFRTHPRMLSIRKWFEYHRRAARVFLKLRLPRIFGLFKTLRQSFRSLASIKSRVR
jgi:FkbM family methyltransferase